MPKDEFDFDDPLELNGVALYTDEDTSPDMAESFVEEFLLMGYNHKQLLALFRNPHYLGMNMVLQNKGEPFVKEVIRDVFARWGRKVEWPVTIPPVAEPVPPVDEPARQASVGASEQSETRGGQGSTPHSCTCGSGVCSSAPGEQNIAPDDKFTDPLGNPIPKLNL
jgi:hypothetical protein